MAQVEKYLVGATEDQKISFFKRAINILENNNISYWLMSGTLLGCIRDHKFIPWDNDIDLAVSTTDLFHLRDAFKKANIEMHRYKEKGHSNTIVLVDLKLPEYSAMDIDLYETKAIRGHLVFRWAIRNNFMVKFVDMFVYLISLSEYNKTGLFPPELSKQIMKIIAKLPDKSQANLYTIFENFLFSILRKRMIMFPDDSFHLMKVEFYDMKVTVPVKWDLYLKLIFGINWDKPDPKYRDRENKLIMRKIDGYEIVALDPETALKIRPGDLT